MQQLMHQHGFQFPSPPLLKKPHLSLTCHTQLLLIRVLFLSDMSMQALKLVQLQDLNVATTHIQLFSLQPSLQLPQKSLAQSMRWFLLANLKNKSLFNLSPRIMNQLMPQPP